MASIKQTLGAIARIGSRRPSEAWHFIRQAVHEVHFALEGATRLVGELDARLARLEADAQQRERGAPAHHDSRQRKARTPRRGTRATAGASA